MAFAFNDNEDNEYSEIGDQSEDEVFSEAEALEWSGELLEADSKQAIERVLRKLLKEAKHRSGFDIAGHVLTSIGRFFMSMSREGTGSPKYSGEAIVKSMKEIRRDSPTAKAAQMESEFGEVAPLMDFVQAVGTSVRAAGEAEEQAGRTVAANPRFKSLNGDAPIRNAIKVHGIRISSDISALRQGRWIRNGRGDIELLPCPSSHR